MQTHTQCFYLHTFTYMMSAALTPVDTLKATSSVSYLLSIPPAPSLLPPLLCKYLSFSPTLSFLPSLRPYFLPSSLCSSPSFPSLPSEIAEKIAQGQIRGWLPLCVTSKDKYSQDDSHWLQGVYVCTYKPQTHTHTLPHTNIHVR